MHEMAITQGIIDICEQHAGSRRVLTLDVEIGELSGVVPEAVQFCFETCVEGTMLEGAHLNIIRIPAIGECEECGFVSPVSSLFDACTKCGGYRIVLKSGEEMRVREIEVE